MQEYLNENTLFATVAMILNDSKGLVLVVEGGDDHLTLKDHCSAGLQLISGTGGKVQVVNAAKLAFEVGLTRAKFLVDRDFDMEDGALPSNLLVSETHDFFVDVIANDRKLLPKLIDVHSASARRRPLRGDLVPSSHVICSLAIELATHLAVVRLVDHRLQLGINFKSFSFGSLRTRDFNGRAIAEKVLANSGRSNDVQDDFYNILESTREEVLQFAFPPIGDHDLFFALARVLKESSINVNHRELQRGFILAIECRSIVRTRWYREVQDWCTLAGSEGFNCREELFLVA